MPESPKHHSMPSDIWDYVPTDDELEPVEEGEVSAEEAALHVEGGRSPADVELAHAADEAPESVAGDEEAEFANEARRREERKEADYETDVAEVLTVQHYLSD